VISVGESAGQLSFTAADDGQGIDVARARSGSGIQNMMDRMAALHGSLDWARRRTAGRASAAGFRCG
jgi:signal transduction histidine kinase